MIKNIVSIQEISEFDIRPKVGVNQWRTYVNQEIETRWTDRSKWIQVHCPSCEKEELVPAFTRYGIDYVECKGCGSLYAIKRPAEEELWAWYRESKPAVFWREQILPASESARLEKILRPRADWILDGIAEYHKGAERVIDLSPHARGLLELLITESHSLKEIVAAGATADFEGLSTDTIRVAPTLPSHLADLGSADVIVALDTINRVADPNTFIANLYNTLKTGGLLFLTATVASGFEIQTLWDKSPTIIPPDKLNLPTIQAIQNYFAPPSWEILEISTPGMFDVEMVRQMIEEDRSAPWPRVIRALVERTDLNGRMALVELLQTRRLTSFARIVIRKNK